MKPLLILLLTVGFCTLSHAAPVPNLILNGDFETDGLASWTSPFGTLETVGTNHGCRLKSDGAHSVKDLQQAFTTTVGTKYYVATDLTFDTTIFGGGTTSIAVQAGAGGTTIGSRETTALYAAAGAPQRAGFVFTATTTSTNLVITINANSVLVDNVVVYEIKKSALAGRYSGHATSTFRLPLPDPTKGTYATPIAARVTPEGFFILLSGLSASEGVIFSDGTIDVPGGQIDTGYHLKATIKSGRITMQTPSAAFPTPALTGADASDTAAGTVSLVATQTLVLTRVGN